ncbi:MAG: hypothetical protein A2Y78_00135 [Acidobacteria bacterium RBG_13_68_16]|nr:MAG: hypothetical protein A2Y78_00135 [Acidobacteria bacterium RBG_13_68_16]
MTPRRRAIVELAYYLADHGVYTDPVARAVVEGRDYTRGPGTSCVELLDCVAFAAGCRAPNINRTEHRGRRPQRDLGWFLHGSGHGGRIRTFPRLSDLQPGDFIGYDFDRGGHAAIYLGAEDGVALTADYGQAKGGGRLYSCPIVEGARLRLRGRAVWAAVDVDTLTYTAPAQTVAEWCATHGLPDPGPTLPAEYL